MRIAMSFKYYSEKFLKDETGAELAEYAVGVALLVAIGIVVYNTLGVALNDTNTGTAGDITTADTKLSW
jgi:Flp pilus assembly pilin Flp